MEQSSVPRTSCFHAQQAAEKSIKAIFVFLQVDFPFTHDLNRLRDLLPGEWTIKERAALVELSIWAAEPRYPGDVTEGSRQDAEQAVRQARDIYEMTLEDLKRHGYQPEDEN
jgi:HEPN domain-containing protein